MTTLYPWQTTQWQQLQQRRQSGQLPHALLLHGPEGIGKLDFALAVAESLLCEHPDENGLACGQCKACQLIKSTNHPDFIHIHPEETGKAIKIDQIRELIQLMSLSAHFSGYRPVLISQAEQMNLAASNSLLKTLEEPQANTIIILVTSQISRLPATIRSRCQMLRFAMPEPLVVKAWLTKQAGAEQTDSLLSAANGAPLLARQIADNNMLSLRQQILQDLQAVSAGQRQPIIVAAEWYKLTEANPLHWLYHWLCDMIRLKQGGSRYLASQDVSNELQSFAETIDLVKLYQFLDQVSEAIRLQQTSANGLLLLEGVLLSWTYLKSDTQRKRA